MLLPWCHNCNYWLYIGACISGENITSTVNALTEKDVDLTARLPTDYDNEISDLAIKFNLFLEQLHNMFKQVSDSANHVKSISESVLYKFRARRP